MFGSGVLTGIVGGGGGGPKSRTRVGLGACQLHLTFGGHTCGLPSFVISVVSFVFSFLHTTSIDLFCLAHENKHLQAQLTTELPFLHLNKSYVYTHTTASTRFFCCCFFWGGGGGGRPSYPPSIALVRITEDLLQCRGQSPCH